MHSQLDNGMTVQLKKSFCFFVYILCVFLFTFIRVDLQCACCHWLQGRFTCWSWTFKIHASGWQNRLKSLHVWGIFFLVKLFSGFGESCKGAFKFFGNYFQRTALFFFYIYLFYVLCSFSFSLYFAWKYSVLWVSPITGYLLKSGTTNKSGYHRARRLV